MVGRAVCHASATLSLLILSSFVTPSSAFASPPIFSGVRHRRDSERSSTVLHNIRGGDMTTASSAFSSSAFPSSAFPGASALTLLPAMADALRRTLSTGTDAAALGALYAVSAATVVPLTWYRTGYSFSVGYGLSVATMSAALLCSFAKSSSPSSFLLASPSRFAAQVALVYGLRLAAFIYAREQTVEEKKKQFQDMDKTPPLKRTPLALAVSLLYAFMVSPVLFALRRGAASVAAAGSSASDRAQAAFACVAAFGVILESVADQHKYEAKKRGSNDGKVGGDGDKFVGPVNWSYALCRHPNYLGEILHWVGLFGVGSVSFGKSLIAWACGILGLWGILGIMFGASSRLDKKQSEKYGGLAQYEEWKGRVRWSVIPFIK